MIISIASGKGGTGKTTVAVNLALSLETVQLIDCDVEEPNVHLFFNTDLERVEEVSIPVPRVDIKKCDFCRKCAEFCEYHAIAVVPNEVLVFNELCHGCGGCTLVCPQDAITEERRVLGYIDRGKHDGIDLWRGVLNPGEPMATPLIRQLKKRIDPNKTVILDAPPGTACPVIETVQGSDFTLLVSEPTPFGLADLRIAIDVLKELELKYGVVLNRADIGDKGVEDFCTKEEIPILMKIPHSFEIASLYSEGRPFVLELEDWREKFLVLYEQILRVMET
ncbi:MAG: (4Fe-4S)-binding protein [Methanomassiliicoccales archaeon]|nr:MAG: (4Fe-4S)-binding protein [Methanomassiliicoccales archaeon]